MRIGVERGRAAKPGLGLRGLRRARGRPGQHPVLPWAGNGLRQLLTVQGADRADRGGAGGDRARRGSAMSGGAVAARALAERVQAWEGEYLSPPAARSYPARRRGRGARQPGAHALPARPRPHPPHQVVPAAEAQDAGVRRARGRPLPHPAHAHARGERDRTHGGAGARPQRGPDRGDRARTRPRAPALRPYRRGGARRVAARALRAEGSSTTSTRCGWSRCSSATGAGST